MATVRTPTPEPASGEAKRANPASLADVSRIGRRRRPSGEAPPLPRPINASGRFYVVAGVAVLAFWLLILSIEPVFDAVTRADVAVLQWIEGLRSDPLTDVMKALHALGSEWPVRLLRWGTLLLLLGLRRFRHLLVFLGAILLANAVSSEVALAVGRPRPVGIELIGGWDGYAHPSRPVVALGISLMGILYTLVPGGTWRNRAKWVTLVPIVLLCASRLYLGVDHPTDIAVALVVGMALPVIGFRILAPNEVFPVVYGGGKAAHLDVSGRRGVAIAQALDQQMGLDLASAEPFALDGSAGSTPLRLRIATEPGEPEAILFGKLYAGSHLRSDRWYKLGRAIVYGRLEDESTFSSVRQLVEYEDYLLRLMRDAELPTAEPYGFVEITPEREYLIVTGFFEGATEISEATVDDAVIDDAMAVVRRLWDVGLAHRDIKPANVLVRDSQVLLIDVAFGSARPSPWRQAVDLANMMLTLALRNTPERVYERARIRFSAEEVAEAFAATRSVTIPSQLRFRLREDVRDLVGAFRRLAPDRAPISVRVWSLRRFRLLLGVLAAALITVGLVLYNLRGAGLL